MRPAQHCWSLEPHVCRACFGRIASRPADGDEDSHSRVYQCTNCGLEAEGAKASVVCACGTKVRKGGKASASFVDAGLRCHANQEPSPAFPSQFVASYAGAQGGQ